MEYWYYFWIANFLLAGSAFVGITVVVLVRGIVELRELFIALRPADSPLRIKHDDFEK